MRPHPRPGVAAALAAAVALLVSLDPARAAEDGPVPSVRSSGLRVATIPVEGMACLSCAASIKRAVKTIEGVSDAEVDLVRRSLRVSYPPGRTLLLDRVTKAIDGLGYKAGTPVIAP
jgi:copper chaperone CopZ